MISVNYFAAASILRRILSQREHPFGHGAHGLRVSRDHDSRHEREKVPARIIDGAPYPRIRHQLYRFPGATRAQPPPRGEETAPQRH